MRNLTLSLFVVLLLLPFMFTAAFAQDKAFNSYEAFWPMVAGRTRGESLYSLKLFKEQLRGYLIFGTLQKADYQVLLSTKRLLEAEKIIGASDKGFVTQTLTDAKTHLQSAVDLYKKVTDKSASTEQDHIKNLKLLVAKLLTSATGDVKTSLDQVSKLLEQL